METNINELNNSYTKVRDYDNKELRALFKEIWNISNLDAPRQAKHTVEMKLLFSLEKTSYNNWADQFCHVRRAIEIEILNRVRTDKL